MNGRIYDPFIGRFMSADPFVQDSANSQTLNRYAYVNNNPLSFTDPTGYFSLGGFLKMIITVVIMVVAFYVVAPALVTAWGAVGANAFAGAVAGALTAGITSGGDLKSILVGAVGGAAFGALGAANITNDIARVAAYGTTGGVTSVMGGGKLENGAITGAFAYAVGSMAAAEPQYPKVAALHVDITYYYRLAAAVEGTATAARIALAVNTTVTAI